LCEAAVLRQQFIRGLTTSKGKAPAGTLRLAVELLVDSPFGLPAPEDLAYYLGCERTSPDRTFPDKADSDKPDLDDADAGQSRSAVAELVRKAPERRLPALLLAVVAVGAEDNLAACDESWAYSPTLALRWLSFLAGAGHELTEAEALLMDEAHQSLHGEGEVAGP
jgi:hypothetical protein